MTESHAGSLLEECNRRIELGSKSFSFASRVFSAREREGAVYLYAWCRFVDDAIDKLDESDELRSQLPFVLNDLKAKTHSAFEGNPAGEIAFRAISDVSLRRKIPEYYATELLEGMAMDVARTHYETQEDLLVYCYRVAGTVGLMMTHIMGARSEEALKHAGSLGIAMQLTNIARDVYEDARLGRVYLPSTWIREAGIQGHGVEAVLNASDEGIRFLRQKLLVLAESYYQKGLQGTCYLRFRSSLTIRVAAYIYRDIGRKILRQDASHWKSRAVVSFQRKVWLSFLGILSSLSELPVRIREPYRERPITVLWRLSI